VTKEEADNALREAIFNHAEAYGLTAEDELMSDYAIIVHWQQISAEESQYVSRYTTQYSRQSLPHHVSQGLFQAGVDINRWIPDRRTDEEEGGN
jgi:hypothetical protein